MIGNQKTKDDGFISVGTKVPVWIADLLTILAKMRGMEVYELLQLLINGFITAAKCEGPVSTDMRLLLEALKVDSAWNQAFNFASPTARQDIAQMILILQQRDAQGNVKRGFGLTMIDKPYFNDARQTLCVDDILERVAEVSMRGLYKQLRQVGVELESQSLRETLTLMCDAQQIANLDEQEHNELPGYDNRHDYGNDIEYGRKHKRVPHRTPDSVANQQQRIVFDDYDREVADYEAKEWEGEHRQHGDDLPEGMTRPFDQEW